MDECMTLEISSSMQSRKSQELVLGKPLMRSTHGPSISTPCRMTVLGRADPNGHRGAHASRDDPSTHTLTARERPHRERVVQRSCKHGSGPCQCALNSADDGEGSSAWWRASTCESRAPQAAKQVGAATTIPPHKCSRLDQCDDRGAHTAPLVVAALGAGSSHRFSGQRDPQSWDRNRGADCEARRCLGQRWANPCGTGGARRRARRRPLRDRGGPQRTLFCMEKTREGGQRSRISHHATRPRRPASMTIGRREGR